MNFSLAELEAQLYRSEPPWRVHTPVSTLADAHGIFFLCPKCFAENKGNVGTHGVLCWFEDRVPDDVEPGPGRWKPTGTGINDLSFVPGKRSNSVALRGGCGAHFFVENGRTRP